MKILCVVGNRPQFIKSAPLSLALRAERIDEVVVHTGQHYDRELSRVFFDELGITAPAHSLDLRTSEVDAMAKALEDAVRSEAPDAVLVFGDTNSTLAGTLAAESARVSVAHVEAGLRSGDLAMPEERNRIEIDRRAAILFAPDERSREILAAEGIAGNVHVVGDVMADAARLFGPIALRQVTQGRAPGSYVLVTVHREANVFQPRLGRIVDGLNSLDEPVVFPIHPRTRAAIVREQLVLSPHIELLPPVGYLEFTALASQARVIVTDSGGLQKEAYWHGVPCVTLRPSTEWVDTVVIGANVLVDDDPTALAAAVAAAHMPGERPQLYGDGHASERIAEILTAA
jgi:UDP-N-acetylglucosamine 2-epimerase